MKKKNKIKKALLKTAKTVKAWANCSLKYLRANYLTLLNLSLSLITLNHVLTIEEKMGKLATLSHILALEEKVDKLANLFQQVSVIMMTTLMQYAAQFDMAVRSIVSLLGGTES